MTAAAVPGIAEQLEAVYGTGYAGFATLDQVDEIMAERTRHFVGRDDQLAALDAFVAGNSCGVMVLAAPSGFGKSVLLANWGPRQAARGAAVAYHFFSAAAERTTEPTDALKGLLMQLAFLGKRPAPMLPNDPYKLHKMLNEELCRDAQPDRPLIVILDGLDESLDERFSLIELSEELGQHVYIFASGEPVQNVYIFVPQLIVPAARALRPKYLTEWLRLADRRDYPVLCLDIPQLSGEDVLAWVRGLVPRPPADQEARLAKCLAAISEGVPLFLQLIVDDIRDRRARDESFAAIIGSLEALPASFTEYAAQQLLAMGEMQRQTPGAVDVARVFALLTLAKGALPLDDLRQVLQTSANPQAFDPRITRWFARCSVGDEPAIAFHHPCLAEVFRSTLAADTLTEIEGRLVAHCASAWSKGSLYALTNLPLHQVEAGQVADAIATLTDLAFLDARFGHEAAPRLIERTAQDFEAADDAAPPELRAETSLHRCLWGDVYRRLLELARGPQHHRAPEVLRQLLRDSPMMAERYATGEPAWLQVAGRITPTWWRINGQPPTPPQERIGHRMYVRGAAALSDGRLLSWSDDTTLRLWTSDGAPLAELKGHRGRIFGATALSDGRLLSWSDDGTLRLWANEGAALAELKGHGDGSWVHGATELRDGRLLSWSDEPTLRLWTSDGAPLAELRGHSGPIWGTAVLSDGRLLSCSGDETLRLWASDGAPLAELIGHDDTAYGATELSDGRLLSWTVGATLRLWASDGAALAELKGHSGRVWGVAELKDGRQLSWSDDTTLRLWARDGAPLAELKGHNNGILGAKVLSDGRLLSWSVDGTLRLWSSDGAPLAELKGHTHGVMGAIELGDGHLLSWGSHTLRLWQSDGAFQSLWLWPHGDIDAVIPHADRPGVFWVLANVRVLQVRHQPAGATEQILRGGAP
jgi:WD40 domain-containing protein